MKLELKSAFQERIADKPEALLRLTGAGIGGNSDGALYAAFSALPEPSPES